jgi:formate hydrogenlyase subunit 6/NADH:ubiquinone oxidoreductase subunit I
MPKTISTQNLHALLDRLISAGTRVVGPKQAGTMTLYAPLASGAELVLGELPRRSAKEAFFPICESILSYRSEDGKTQVADPDLARLPATLLIGARPCDATAAPVLDAVFSWDYQDEFYLERRRKTTVVGLACTRCDDACFCTAVGDAPDERKGSDLFLTPLQDGSFTLEALTPQGEELLARCGDLLGGEASATAVPLSAPGVPKFDLKKIKGWLDNHFEDPIWAGIAERCAGCGACAFLCPACHCFDIVDEGGERKGERRKFWDACGFGKFTMHASAHNPRDVQPARYRNRIMHKFKYYDDKFGQTLCTGCGRCVRACPVGVDIAAVLEEINCKP